MSQTRTTGQADPQPFAPDKRMLKITASADGRAAPRGAGTAQRQGPPVGAEGQLLTLLAQTLGVRHGKKHAFQ